MANAKKKSRSTRDPEQLARLRRWCANGGALLAVMVAIGVGLVVLRRYVDRHIVYPTRPPSIVLKNRPIWMTDFLAQQIAESIRPAGIHSAFDQQMLADRVKLLRLNPWIRNVRQVRRAYYEGPGDAIEIDAEYRQPVALVKWGKEFWYVDAKGVKLPERFRAEHLARLMYGQDRHTHIRVIEGVRRPPPVAGKPWGGDDLEAGLALVGLLYGRGYVDDIVKVSVENFGGRRDAREAQLVLGTRHGTEVRWGRPIHAADDFIEVKVERKLDYLSRVHTEFGRIDARQPWIDIRFDKVTYPSPDPLSPHANTQ